MDEIQKLVERIKEHQIAEGDSDEYHIKVELEKDKYAPIWKWEITIHVTPLRTSAISKSEISSKHFRKRHDAENYFKTIIDNYGLTKKEDD